MMMIISVAMITSRPESRAPIMTAVSVMSLPAAGHGRAVLARAGRMLLDKDCEAAGWRPRK